MGYGLSGRVFHAPLIAATPGLEVTSIVTTDPRRAAQARKDFPEADVLSARAFMHEPEGYDLVVVATATSSHVDLATQVLDAGTAVVVEKPLAPTASCGRPLAELARDRGVLLTVFHNRRWDSDFLTLRRILESGELGTVDRFESRFEKWRPEANPSAWRESEAAENGGGVLLDLGVHLVDQARILFGPARSVYAEVYSRRGGADDEVFVDIGHASGVRSHLSAGALFGAPGPRMRVLGTKGAYVVEPLDGQEDALRAGKRPDDPSFGEEPKEKWGRLVRGDAAETVPSERGRWTSFYAGVSAALAGAGQPPVDPEDALAALQILDAARESSRKNSVVMLDAG